MAIKTKNEILESIRSHFADDNSDEAIAFIEDVTDTFTDLETRANGDGVDWKARAKQIDDEWREKYKARFFSGKSVDDEADPEPDDEVKTYTFDELFKKE